MYKVMEIENDYISAECKEDVVKHKKSKKNISDKHKIKENFKLEDTIDSKICKKMSKRDKNDNLSKFIMLPEKLSKYDESEIVFGNDDRKSLSETLENKNASESRRRKRSLESVVSFTEELQENESNKVSERVHNKRMKRKSKNKMNKNRPNKSNIVESCWTNEESVYMKQKKVKKNYTTGTEASTYFTGRYFDYVQDNDNYELQTAPINQCNSEDSSNSKDYNVSVKHSRPVKYLAEGYIKDRNKKEMPHYGIEIKEQKMESSTKRVKYIDSELNHKKSFVNLPENSSNKSKKNKSDESIKHKMPGKLIKYNKSKFMHDKLKSILKPVKTYNESESRHRKRSLESVVSFTEEIHEKESDEIGEEIRNKRKKSKSENKLMNIQEEIDKNNQNRSTDTVESYWTNEESMHMTQKKVKKENNANIMAALKHCGGKDFEYILNKDNFELLTESVSRCKHKGSSKSKDQNVGVKQCKYGRKYLDETHIKDKNKKNKSYNDIEFKKQKKKLETKTSKYLGSEVSESEQNHTESFVDLTENYTNKKKYSTKGKIVPIIMSNSAKSTDNLDEQRILTERLTKYNEATIMPGNNNPKIISKQVEKDKDAGCQKSLESEVFFTEEICENASNKIIDEEVTRKRKKRRKRKPRNKWMNIYNEIDRNFGDNFELTSPVNECNKNNSNHKDQNVSVKRRRRKRFRQNVVEGHSNDDIFEIELKKRQMEYEVTSKYFDPEISSFEQSFNRKAGKNDETIEPLYSVFLDNPFDHPFSSEESGLSDLIESGKGESSKLLQSKNILEQNGKGDYTNNRKNHEDKSQDLEKFKTTIKCENQNDNERIKFASKENVDHGLILPKENSLLTKEDNQYMEGVSEGVIKDVNKEYVWNPEIMVVEGKVYCLDSCKCTDSCLLCHSDKNNYDRFVTVTNDSDVDVSNCTSKSSIWKLNSDYSLQNPVSLSKVIDFAEHLLTKNFVRPSSNLSDKEVRTLNDTSLQRSNSNSTSDKNILLLDDVTLRSKSNSMSVKEVHVLDDAILEKSNNNLPLDKDTLFSDDTFQKSNCNLTSLTLADNLTILQCDSTSNKDILLSSDDISLQRSNSNLTELSLHTENLTDSNDQIIIKNKPVKIRKSLVKSLSENSTKEGTAIIIDKQMHIFKNPTDGACYGIFPLQLTKDEQLLEIEMHDPFSPGEGFLSRNTYHLKKVDAVSLQFNVEPSSMTIKCENEITASNCTSSSIVEPFSVNIKSENESTATNCTDSIVVKPIVHSFEKNEYSVIRSFDKLGSSNSRKSTTQTTLDAYLTPKRL